MTSVKWLGLSAVYSTDERALMAELPVREQTFIHALKALTQGEIHNEEILLHQKGTNPEAGTALALPPEARLQSQVFVDPEDIPFGDPTPRRLKPSESIVVLRWTKDKGRALKTKKAALHKMKIWKRWYERQGWVVKGFDYVDNVTIDGDVVTLSGESMIARAPDDRERHAITLRVHKKRAVAGPLV